jgi:hypothetical protein
MASVNASASALSERADAPCSSTTYQNITVPQSGSWWGASAPASACLDTTLAPGGGSQSLAYSTSVSIAENPIVSVLGWGDLKDILGGTLGITVTETSTSTSTYNCPVLSDSVVQVWAAPFLAWGWFWVQECNSNSLCDGGTRCGPYTIFGATAPAEDPISQESFNYECHNGYENVAGCKPPQDTCDWG